MTIDPPGNGRSDRPTDPAAYDQLQMVADTIAVLDAVGVERAVLVGICSSAWEALLVRGAAPRPGARRRGHRAVVPANVAPHAHKAEAIARFDEERPDDEGWAKLNRHYWRRDWPGFADFFFGEICSEPHSTKLIEDMVGFACESTAEAQIAAVDGAPYPADHRRGRGTAADASPARCSSCTAPRTSACRSPGASGSPS